MTSYMDWLDRAGRWLLGPRPEEQPAPLGHKQYTEPLPAAAPYARSQLQVNRDIRAAQAQPPPEIPSFGPRPALPPPVVAPTPSEPGRPPPPVRRQSKVAQPQPQPQPAIPPIPIKKPAAFDAGSFFRQQDASHFAAGGVADDKADKRTAHYQPEPNNGQMCDDCYMYRPASDTCTSVRGLIAPKGWCKYWDETEDRYRGGKVEGRFRGGASTNIAKDPYAFPDPREPPWAQRVVEPQGEKFMEVEERHLPPHAGFGRILEEEDQAKYEQQLVDVGRSRREAKDFADGGAVIASSIARAEKEVDRNPSEAQKKSGNYAKGHVSFHGLDVAIENPCGGYRRGVDKGGKEWKVKMPAAYGYLKGSEGKDGDHVDVYLGPKHDSDKVYIVDQVDAETGKFDEHKCMLFYPSQQAAIADYCKAFSDGKGHKRIGCCTAMTIDKFKAWLKGDTTKPVAGKRFANGGVVQDLDALSKGLESVTPEEQAAGAASRAALFRQRSIGDEAAYVRNRAAERATGVAPERYQEIDEGRVQNMGRTMRTLDQLYGKRGQR